MWVVEFIDAFEAEFDTLVEDVQDAILAKVVLLKRKGRRSEDLTPTPFTARSTRT
jgi:hypothetical protein